LSFKVYIPARYASTRLPGKPLMDIAGKPLIQHVHERAVESGAAAVVIATDDTRIRDCAASFDAVVCMTSSRHLSGTDRIAEAVSALKEDDHTIVVNVQGDEPGIPPELIQQVADLLEENPDDEMATACAPITEASVLFDPNVVKVVFDGRGHALYFSRAPIPWDRDSFKSSCREGLSTVSGYYRHIGIYAYRVGFLRRFSSLPPCPLEQIESLEQLRALYYGNRVTVTIAEVSPETGVDTPADLERVRALFLQYRH